MVNNNDKITLDWTYLGPIKDISTATIFKSNKTDKKWARDSKDYPRYLCMDSPRKR